MFGKVEGGLPVSKTIRNIFPNTPIAKTIRNIFPSTLPALKPFINGFQATVAESTISFDFVNFLLIPKGALHLIAYRSEGLTPRRKIIQVDWAWFQPENE